MKIVYSCHEIFLKLVPVDQALARAGTACHIGTRGHTVVAAGNRAGERNGLNFKLCFNRQFTVAFFISYGKISFSAEKKNKLFYIILRFTFQTQVGFVPNLISLILAIAGH